jgi:hypothetical protein
VPSTRCFLRKDFDCILTTAPMEMYADSSFLAPDRRRDPRRPPRAPARRLCVRCVSPRRRRARARRRLNRTQTFIPEFLTRLTNPQDVVEIAVIPQEASR